MPRRSGTARIQYIDRNPLNVDIFDNNTYAPHAVTQRWTYTVPTLRLAVVTSIDMNIIRGSVPAVNGLCTNTLTKIAVDIAKCFLLNAVAGAQTSMFIGMSALLLTGETLAAFTEDLSTTGTVNFYEACSILEFDK